MHRLLCVDWSIVKLADDNNAWNRYELVPLLCSFKSVRGLIGMAPFNFNHRHTAPGPVYAKDWWMLVSSEVGTWSSPSKRYDVGCLKMSVSSPYSPHVCKHVCVCLLEEALANWRRLCLGWRWVLGKWRGCDLSIVDFVSLCRWNSLLVVQWWLGWFCLFEGVDLFDCLEGGVDARWSWEVGVIFWPAFRNLARILVHSGALWGRWFCS